MTTSKAKIALLAGLGFLLSVTALSFFIMRNAAQPPPSLPFANLAESEIPGRYKWIDSGHESFMTLLRDHRFMNREGNIFPMYRWDVTPEGLSIRWAAGVQMLTNIEAPGVYTGTSSKGLPVRMVKQADANTPESPPSTRPGLTAAMVTNHIVASIVLNERGETNGLEVVNTGGDGRIHPATIDGVECSQLVRKAKRPEAYLYLRVAPELKEPPFTNAAVLVEYFDAHPIDLRNGFVTVQYDAPAGEYTRLTQRVRLTGTETWKEEIFFLDAPLFKNRMNGGGDLRLCVVNPELRVKSIKLAKNIP